MASPRIDMALRALRSLRFMILARPGPLDGTWCESVLEVFGAVTRQIEAAYEDNNTIEFASEEQLDQAHRLLARLRSELTGRIVYQWLYGPRIELGSPIRFRMPEDRYPHTAVAIGETGVVTSLEEDFLAVQLDQEHDGLTEWDNELHWTAEMYDGGAEEMRWNFYDSIELVVEDPRQRRFSWMS